MHFGFALDLSDKRFVKCRFARSKIYTFRFACFQDVLKTSWRHVFKTSSRYVFQTSSRHVFKTSSRHVFKTSWRRLQRNNFSSSKTSSRRLARCLQDVFKTYLQDVFKTSWKTKNCYAEDVLKTCWRRLEDQQIFAGWAFWEFIFSGRRWIWPTFPLLLYISRRTSLKSI